MRIAGATISFKRLLRQYAAGACLLLAVQSLAACGRDSGPDITESVPEPVRVHALSVARYATSVLSEAAADGILAKATEILQEEHGPGDVACMTRLERSGAVRVFFDGDGSVDTEEDFRSLLALDGYVKIVNEINWCGGFKANILGCAPSPGNSFAAVRFALHPGMEGILWLHEFGHTKGLGHRSDSLAVMNPMLAPERRHIHADECVSFSN